MAPKRHIPFIGGRPERFTGLGFIGAVDSLTPTRVREPVRLCAGDLDYIIRRMQLYNWRELEIKHRIWFADLGVARRVAAAVSDLLAEKLVRDDWYAVPDLAEMVRVIDDGAYQAKVPVLSDRDYRALIPSRDQVVDEMLRRDGVAARRRLN